jgi:alcohol dehydrogenase class IV
VQFTHETLPQRVVFATGKAAAAVAADVAHLGSKRLMVIAAPAEVELAGRVTKGLPVALRHDEVVVHVPVEVAERARCAAAEAEADALLCVGGGSTTGLAKAVALTTGLPIVAVPTTYAGSEATNVWGLTEGQTKTTGVDEKVLPRSIVYDASLLLTLPVELSVASGLNALAHCIDSMWGPRVDPIDHALAGEGIRALAAGLPAVVAEPTGIAGREQTLYGAYLAAVAFASAGSGLHHKICHVLGGMFNLPHAQTHAVVLPTCLPSMHLRRRRPRPASPWGSGRRVPSAHSQPCVIPSRHRSPCGTTACPRTASPRRSGRSCLPRPRTTRPRSPKKTSVRCCAPRGKEDHDCHQARGFC